eukprot:gb/GFBE01075737.1/.p1 GENE.gb/GFBE01075737.1/~~gb/GFBE01075737.1/.p1  ORF type:complete len:145 (+),score=47.74 gb/GFBE01075737.1/:1-435(+)
MDVDYDEDAPQEKPTGRKVKGRGAEEDDRYAGKAGKFESLEQDDEEGGPARSIEGWVVIVSGVHEEAQEDDVFEAFAEFGDIKNLHLNLDRRTGFVKGYAFIEYESKAEADSAIKGMDGQALLDSKLAVQWAFSKPGAGRRKRR